jgi:RNA polymerase sigma-70 factor (ECF subfamily)
MDDTDLVRRLNDDDPLALEDAYKLYARRCNAVAYRVLHDDVRAEDAVQETFLTLWRHRKGLLVRTAGIAPWLLTVARNAALATLRADQRRTLRETRTFDPQAALEADPFERVSLQTTGDQVRAAVAELPAEQRDVVALAYYKFMTMREISERTGAPLGTVKRRAQLALQRLARTLQGQAS